MEKGDMGMIGYGSSRWPVDALPGMPDGFPTKQDFEVIRALVRMAVILHEFVEPSANRPGHRFRWLGHMRRIREGQALEALSPRCRRVGRRRRAGTGDRSWRP